jgi:hypothetical protein
MLDRVLANVDWLDRFGGASVDILESGISNHSPAVISVAQLKNFGPKPFKCFNFWSEHDEFLAWVGKGWSIPGRGVQMLILYSRRRAVKRVLKSVNKFVWGN